MLLPFMEQMVDDWLQGREQVGEFFAEPNRPANRAVPIAAQIGLEKSVLLKVFTIDTAANPTTENQPLRFSGKAAPLHLFGLDETLGISPEGIRERLQIIAKG
jgi:hypothetical protein